MSGARFAAGHERLPLGRELRLRDRARHRAERLRAAIGALNFAGQLVDPLSWVAAPAVPVRSSVATAEPSALSELSRLVYELLDAHDDTAQIARDHDLEVIWEAHLDYLRALQRKGRELLALLDGPPTGPWP